MKKQQLFKLWAIAIFLYGGCIIAQNVSTEYADRMDYIFANVDKNRNP